jgi:hypothetical protein
MTWQITLLSLLAIHWAADFTQLSTPTMLAAKRYGMPLFPIWQHALLHGVLMGIFIALLFNYEKGAACCLVITITHFAIGGFLELTSFCMYFAL